MILSSMGPGLYHDHVTDPLHMADPGHLIGPVHEI